ETEEPGNRGRHAAPPHEELQRSHQADSGWCGGRNSLRARLLEWRRHLGGGTPNRLERYGMATTQLELLHLAWWGPDCRAACAQSRHHELGPWNASRQSARPRWTPGTAQ